MPVNHAHNLDLINIPFVNSDVTSARARISTCIPHSSR